MHTVSYPIPSDLQSPLIELIYAGSALAAGLTSYQGEVTLCVFCGLFSGHATNPDHHVNTSCPVARYYRAVEELDTAVRKLEALRQRGTR